MIPQSPQEAAKKLQNKIIKRLVLGVGLSVLLPLLLISCSVLMVVGPTAGGDIAVMRNLEIPGEYLDMAKQMAVQQQMDFIKLLVISTELAGQTKEYNQATLDEAIKRINEPIEPGGQEDTLYQLYKRCYGPVKYGPIPRSTEYKVFAINEDGSRKEIERYTVAWKYSHCDDFGAGRYYKGERTHKGNDIICPKLTPIVSMTDGIITRLGWNELGGWRIGITDENGSYWYYAHTDHYAKGLYIGQKILAGTVIGYVGNTGYGPEGTSGKFIDHLHLQIGIKMDEIDRGEEEYTWINPYPLVEWMKSSRIDTAERVYR